MLYFDTSRSLVDFLSIESIIFPYVVTQELFLPLFSQYFGRRDGGTAIIG